MNNKEKLTEATMLALQDKLTESDIESFNYLDENDKPRDTEFGLNMQIDGTEKILSRLKRKLYKANLTDVERHNAKTYIDYYTDLLDIYKTKLSDILVLQSKSDNRILYENYSGFQYVEDWKRQELNNYLEAFDKQMARIDQLALECKQYNWKLDTLEAYRQIPSIFKKYRFNRNKQAFKEEAEKEIDNHFNKLQQKVEKIIGDITMIQPTGENGYDYLFKGTKGSCEVKVILAGGYNIQRLHTRWIINK